MGKTTVAVRTLSAVAALATRGRARDLLRSAGFAPHLLDDPDARIPRDVAEAIWERAERALDGPCLGMHAARALPLGALGVPEYALGNSATLGQGLRQMARLARLFYDAHEIEIAIEGSVARILHHVHDAQPPEQPVELLFGRIVVLAERVTGAKLPVHEVGFGHDTPKDTAEHRRLFGVPARFGRGASEIVFDAAALERPIPGADLELGAILAAYADRLLGEVYTSPADLGTRVRARVAAALARGIPTVRAMARDLGTSTRSLQRRLAREGTSYDALVDDVRREIALRGVRDEHVSLGALALDLGFADLSAFYRAFRRWTGTTPGEVRGRRASSPKRSAPFEEVGARSSKQRGCSSKQQGRSSKQRGRFDEVCAPLDEVCAPFDEQGGRTSTSKVVASTR